MRIIFLFFLPIWASCSSFTDNDCSNFENLFREHEELFIKNKDTIGFIGKIVEVNDKNPCFDAYLTIIDLSYVFGMPEVAKENLKRAYLIDSNNVYLNYQYGNFLASLGSYIEAIYYFDKALDQKTYNNVTIDFNSRISNAKAKYDVSGTEIVYQRSYANYKLNNLNEAASGFLYCKSNNYKEYQCCFYLGYIYFYSNRFKESCEYFMIAKTLNSQNLTIDSIMKTVCIAN